jgi:hypothetical protein
MKTPEGYEKADVDKYLNSLNNCCYFCPYTGGYGRSGAPDRIALIEGTFWGIEVKREGKESTVKQASRMREIRAAGGMAVAGTAAVIIAAIEKWRASRG